MTIGFDLGHDLDLEFSRSNIEFAISQPKMVRLPRNEKQTYRWNSRPQMWPMVWIYQIVTGVTSVVGVPSTHLVCNDVYTFSWMIDNTCVILSMNVHFDIKRQEKILCKIPSDSNARNIILSCEFSNAVLGHVILTFLGMNKKTQSYIFTSGSWRLRTPRPLEINMETDVLFSYCH